MNLHARLKKEREQSGLKQEEFAKGCGVTALTQRNYENGKRQPPADYLEKVAQMGVDLNYLFTGQKTVGLSLTSLVNPEQHYRLPTDLVESFGANQKHLFLFKVADDAMAPLFHPNDAVVVEGFYPESSPKPGFFLSDADFPGDGYYLIRWQRKQEIRRLEMLEEGLAIILPEEPPFVLTPAQAEGLKILGRVHWRGGVLG